MFTEKDKMKALAIVHVFETGEPFGDYAAYAVLNDGAGVSYGINQFTHRSGSLALVVRAYLRTGGSIGRQIFEKSLPVLATKTAKAIDVLSADREFKKALIAAAATDEMRMIQRQVADKRYLRPAIDICEQMGFTLPLSLAVVYDSVTHGSWNWIAARVTAIVKTQKTSQTQFEKVWITEYIRQRHHWLTEIRRLRVTNYRTKFFLDQIAIGNWDLRLPVTVHGVRLGDVMPDAERFGQNDAGSKQEATAAEGPADPVPAGPGEAATQDTSILESASDLTSAAVARFDRVDGFVTAVTTRKDAAKSLWTTIAGTISQAAWGIFGFAIGLPRTVWIVVAVIAGALMLLYLYRQIALGRIRELRSESRP